MLTNLHCDGCGRKPNLAEWMKGEFGGGYDQWRHPGIVFKEAGVPFEGDTQSMADRIFRKLFGRPIPVEMDYLCPTCNTRAARELPRLIAEDPGDPEIEIGERAGPRHYMG
jgi:hypothetical protein